MSELQEIIDGFTECLLFVECDEKGDPLGRNYTASDFAPETVKTIRQVCAKFRELIKGLDYRRDSLNIAHTDAEYAGHDLWLTIAGHGAGFWESGRWLVDDKPDTEILCAAARKAAEGLSLETVYVGDDGKLYF